MRDGGGKERANAERNETGRERERATTYERMVAAKERQGAGEEREEGTIGGKSGRPRKGGRVWNERGETHHIKPRRAEKKRFALPGLAMG